MNIEVKRVTHYFLHNHHVILFYCIFRYSTGAKEALLTSSILDLYSRNITDIVHHDLSLTRVQLLLTEAVIV